MTVLFSLLSLYFFEYIFLENLWSFSDHRSACLLHLLQSQKIKQFTHSQDIYLGEAITFTGYRPAEDVLVLLAKCYVKAPLKPLSSVFSVKTWKYCKHLEFVLSLHLSLYSKLTTTFFCTGTHACTQKFPCKLYSHISVVVA